MRSIRIRKSKKDEEVGCQSIKAVEVRQLSLKRRKEGFAKRVVFGVVKTVISRR
jgi:hypothetical protein